MVVFILWTSNPCHFFAWCCSWQCGFLNFKYSSWESSENVFSGMDFIVASLPLQSRKVCNEKHPRLQVHVQVMCRLNNPLSKKKAVFFFFSLFSEIRLSYCELYLLLGWAQEVICLFIWGCVVVFHSNEEQMKVPLTEQEMPLHQNLYRYW